MKIQLEGCRCPGTPHHHDEVELADAPTIEMGSAAMAAIRIAGDDEPRIVGLLGGIYLRFGITGWSFTNEDGNPIPVVRSGPDWAATVDRLLPWAEGGSEVAEAADVLYSEQILRPLISRLSMRSQGGQTEGSTSATLASGSKHRTRSGRSSRTSTGGRRSGARGR